MSKYWFGVNRYWGWYPKSTEGFIVIIGMVLSIASTAYLFDTRSHSLSDTLINIFPFVSLIIAFTMVVASLKGARPEFGKEHRKSKNFSSDNPKSYLILCLFTLPAVAYYLFFQAYLGAFVLLLVFGLLYFVYSRLISIHKKS